MSVFLALVFQVLFVFFAMVINIGLLVHDKINLQNSVDLGAYYAAQKQAEILNEIAHLNYQIRQDYKLLAWRYWVLGTLGRDGGPPNVPFPPPARSQGGVPPDGRRFYRGIEEAPVACLATPQWWEFAILRNGQLPNENYCYQPFGWVSKEIPVPFVPPTPATIGVNLYAAAMARDGRSNFVMSCDAAGPLSWAFVASIMTSYKHSVAYKKKAIRALRANLVSEIPLDRDGVPIREGVIQTIKKNLTESNLQSFDPATVQVLNGLSKGGCDGGGVYPGETALPEILTGPGLYYAVIRSVGNACSMSVDFQRNFDGVAAPGVGPWDPDGYMRSILLNEPLPSDDLHSSLGFEKNPWCMAYMGVKANTKPRKPFAPFGKAVDLVARAFAQPFGGRIGPWYSKTWTRMSPTSDPVDPPRVSGGAAGNAAVELNPGPGQGNRTDPLTSPRIISGSGGYVYSSYTIPNFSRFPGDQLGLRSQLAQSQSRQFFTSIRATSSGALGTNPTNFTDNRIRLNWFYTYGTISTAGDSLAFDNPVATNLGAVPDLVKRFREVEMSAVAPDLFDVTYYSIDPAANENYTELARRNPARYGVTGSVPVGDLGTRQNLPEYQKFTIESQITAAMNSGVDPSLRSSIYWLVRSWEHLLTGWSPNLATDFSFPTFRFGKCHTPPIEGAMIPGKCVGGGRVGYSVRLISRAHLNGDWQIGGENVAAGPILNPPGDDTQF